MRPTTNLSEYELEELLGQRCKWREAARKSRASKKAVAPRPEPGLDYTLTEAEAAYIAGFFDGEGMVTISRQYSKGSLGKRINPAYTMSVCISQSEKEVLDWVYDRCGGSITEKRIKQKGRRHWVLAKKSNSARTLLEKILPYLVVKREQVVHALRFQELQNAHKNRYEAGRTGPIPRTMQEIAYKEYYRLLLKSLKHC